MDLEAKIGQLLFLGFEGTAPSAELGSWLERIRPGGLILFSRNIKNAGQVLDLNRFVAEAVHPRPFVAVDQEGGRVSRLRPVFPPLPSAASLARFGPGRVRAFAAALGAALRTLGFNTDFAPVLDLSVPGAANLIGDRAFGDDPLKVAECGRAFVEGLAESGIASFVKHFPGLGATEVDSHLALPTCTRDAGEMWQRDLHPFRVCAPLAAGVMVGHVHCPAFDPGHVLPATLSKAVIEGLLRFRLGNDGIALTDDLGMGAVRDAPAPALARRSLAAGCDMIMFCNDFKAAEDARWALIADAQSGAIDAGRIDRSIERILASKRRNGILEKGSSLSPSDWSAALERLSDYVEA